MRTCKICGKQLVMISGLLCLDHKRFDTLWGRVVRNLISDWPRASDHPTHAEMQITERWRAECRWEVSVIATLAAKGVEYR